MTPRFSISILAMDNLDLTQKCIESVLKYSKDFELLLTDNGSKDGTAEFFESLRKHAENITDCHGVFVTTNAENKGFVDPNRHALSLARGEFFLMLNNDTEVCPGWLEALERPFRIHPTAALSGPQGGGCTLMADLRGFPGKVFEYLEGSCLMCRVSIVRKLGLFAPYIEFAYGEDSDLSLRARQAGYTIHRAAFTLKHVGRATSQHIPNIHDIERRNHSEMHKRWDHYLRTRRMDYPILLKRSAAIGDVLLLSALAKTMRAQRPQSRILIQTKFPELFERNPDVTQAGLSIPHDPAALQLDLDMAYENRPGMHILDAYADACGLDPYPVRVCRMYPSNADMAKASTWIGTNGIEWCAVAPFPTTWNGKNWPHDRWVGVIRYLRGRGMKVALVGNGVGTFESDIDLRNATTFMTLAAVLRGCRFFVGHDSFPIHAAQSVGCPVLGLFGTTRASFILTDGSPWIAIESSESIPCSGERHRVSGSTHVDCDGACMKSITTDEVIQAIGENFL